MSTPDTPRFAAECTASAERGKPREGLEQPVGEGREAAREHQEADGPEQQAHDALNPLHMAFHPTHDPAHLQNLDRLQQHDDPDRPMPQSQHWRQDIDLQHAHDNGAKTKYGTNRQIDVSGDDHQHHPGCHDADA